MSALTAGRVPGSSNSRSTQYTCHGKLLRPWFIVEECKSSPSEKEKRMQVVVARESWCRSICLHEAGNVDNDNIYSMETSYTMTFPRMHACMSTTSRDPSQWTPGPGCNAVPGLASGCLCWWLLSSPGTIMQHVWYLFHELQIQGLLLQPAPCRHIMEACIAFPDREWISSAACREGCRQLGYTLSPTRHSDMVLDTSTVLRMAAYVPYG